ncbi:guanylate kinase [Halpernia frigidisoli]|uniref:Guanylate kinase n=1 Tax=Halpernia frigidisoli TaxID=1125876 RepID=A0A1I3IKS7_9FLAO|nr:guanylate kinase [Halpernia frigidisoli]SFI48531.1 guanylate kinase [Halpernia frigidisoli]
MEKVIIFSAPSGSGKTTLVKYAISKFENLAFSVSCTTRAPRGEEIHEIDYFFISPDEFKSRISTEEFVEFEEVYKDKFYGTLKSEVKKNWKNSKVVIFDVDVKGGVALKKYFGEKALSIFIKPPSVEELQRRLTLRGTDDVETVKIRVEKATEELTFEDKFDKIIINDDLNKAKSELDKIISEFIK